MKAKVSEIFKSIQGEGLYQGKIQVFIRFFGCNLNCSFCDTKLDLYKYMNVDEILKNIEIYKDYHSISLTGGEPLLVNINFLKRLCSRLKKDSKVIYLETNGILYKNLEVLIDYIDIVSMDFKLPSSTGLRSFWGEHKRFLEIAQKREVFVKAVICENTSLYDIIKSIEIIKSVNPKTYFILQPQNPYEDLLNDKLMYFKNLCNKNNINVKITYQLHKKLSIL